MCLSLLVRPKRGGEAEAAESSEEASEEGEEELANTGVESAGLAIGAVAAIFAGMMLLSAHRRRLHA